MIYEVQISNFKSISSLTFSCSNVNLFVGINSSGKSSILQAVLLFIQNIYSRVGLNGELVKIGVFKDASCAYARSQTIKIQLKIDEVYGKLSISDEVNMKFDGIKKIKTKMEQMQVLYLSCHRVGPQNMYEKNVSIGDTIGINGEYAISYLDKHGSDKLDECLCKYTEDYTLLGQVNYWLKLFCQVEISTEEISGTDYVKAMYSKSDVKNIRPVNIGAGISYLISVLIVCLSSRQSGIIIIENPEIHLHPKAQSLLADFFEFIGRNNRQLFIESHSDHIFNGFRAGITNGTMKKDKINIFFTSLRTDATTQIMPVEIGRMGRVMNQCDDLFDQFDIDLNKMIGL